MTQPSTHRALREQLLLVKTYEVQVSDLSSFRLLLAEVDSTVEFPTCHTPPFSGSYRPVRNRALTIIKGPHTASLIMNQ